MSTNSEFAIAEVMPGKLNALVKNIMKQTGTTNPDEAVRLVNSGEWIVIKQMRKWYGQDGIIYLSVTSDGTTGPQWIERLEDKHFRVSDYAKQVLRSSDFKPTSGTTTKMAILKGTRFKENDRIKKTIYAEAQMRKLRKPNAEVACLIRDNFSDDEIEEMGLECIVTMHEPIEDFDNDPSLLGVCRLESGRWFATYSGNPGVRWNRGTGFAYEMSPEAPEV